MVNFSGILVADRSRRTSTQHSRPITLPSGRVSKGRFKLATSDITKLLLERRGFTDDYLSAIENPEHGLLKDIDLLCERLHRIQMENAKIAIVPDFDMDGIMSGVCGYAGLSALGFDCELFRPNTDRYGIYAEDIENLAAAIPDVAAIITCDTGIGCKEAALRAKELGIEVLVTDHHKEDEECSVRGIADVVVDPCAIGEDYEHPAICGAFVMWQVIDRYADIYDADEKTRRAIELLRVFAGIGTVSDTMPVLYENRSLVRDAVEISKECLLANDKFKARLAGLPEAVVDAMRGLYTVLSYLKRNGKIADISKITEDTFGFYIAPMFNSIKRMNSDIGTAFDIFLGQNRTVNVSVLGELNEERKRIVKEAFEIIRKQDNAYAPFLYVCNEKPGILGLLAMNFMNLTKMPTLVVARGDDGSFHGSGRSPEWFPFNSIAQDIPGLTCRGHEGSFGCRIAPDTDLTALFSEISKKVEQLQPDEESLEAARAELSFSTSQNMDFVLDAGKLLAFADDLENLRPFGRGFEKPTVMVQFKGAESNARTIGSEASHLKMNVNGVDIICWGQGAKQTSCLASDTVKVIGDVSVNEYKGIRKAQIVGELVL